MNIIPVSSRCAPEAFILSRISAFSRILHGVRIPEFQVAGVPFHHVEMIIIFCSFIPFPFVFIC